MSYSNNNWLSKLLERQRQEDARNKFLTMLLILFVVIVVIVLAAAGACILSPFLIPIYALKKAREKKLLFGILTCFAYIYFILDITYHWISSLFFFGSMNEDQELIEPLLSEDYLTYVHILNGIGLAIGIGFIVLYFIKNRSESPTVFEKSVAENGIPKEIDKAIAISEDNKSTASRKKTIVALAALIVLSISAVIIYSVVRSNTGGSSGSLPNKYIADEIELDESDPPSEADITAQQPKEEAINKIQEYLYALEDPMQYNLTDHSGNHYTGLDEWHNFIGWAGNSTFYFVEYSCDGGCGCCGADIRSYDLVYDSIESIRPYRVNEEVPLYTWDWVDSSKYLVQAFNELQSVINQFNISADGPGTFYRAGTGTHAGNIEHVIFEQNEIEFQCLFYFSDGTFLPVWSGSKEVVLNDWLSTENEPFYSEVMVSYLGYFQHPTNDNQLLICFLEGSAGGYENEIESGLKFVPFNSSKAKAFKDIGTATPPEEVEILEEVDDYIPVVITPTPVVAATVEEVIKKDVFEVEEIFEFVEQPPEFPGGAAEMYNYLGKEVKYPEMAREAGIQGKVYVKFVVKKDGTIGEVKVVRGVHKTLDREAIRAIKNMPKWTAGEEQGKKVSVWFTLPVNFRIG